MSASSSSARPRRVLGVVGSILSDGDAARAVGHVLEGAAAHGAEVARFGGDDLRMPIYHPRVPTGAYGDEVARWLAAFDEADAFVWASPVYHGAVSGAFKNALDHLQARSASGYLRGRPVGLVATAGGTLAAPFVLSQMTHIAHTLRGWVVPLMVPVHRASSTLDPAAPDEAVVARLRELGRLLALEPIPAAAP